MNSVLLMFGVIGLVIGMTNAAFGNRDNPLAKAVSASAMGLSLLLCVIAFFQFGLWAAGAMFCGFSVSASLGASFIQPTY